MSLLQNKHRKSKYKGRILSPEKINSVEETNNHKRRERKKDVENNIVIVGYILAMVAIPALYAMLLWANWDSKETITTYIWSGITALVGYVFGNKTGKKND